MRRHLDAERHARTLPRNGRCDGYGAAVGNLQLQVCHPEVKQKLVSRSVPEVLDYFLWAEVLLPTEERAAWLHALGTTDIAVDLEPSADGTLWTTWRHAGIWFEAGWQTVAVLDETVGALRVLFAINRRWERGWKWLHPASRTLAVKPARLVERVDAIFAAADPAMAVRVCLELVLDVLALAPPSEAAGRAQTTIREALRLRGG